MSEAVSNQFGQRGPDRRVRPTPMLSRYTFFGRRRGFRRAGEGRNAYLDRYGPGLLAVLLTITALCVLDALFTLQHLQRGGQELNPIMRAVLRLGHVPFVLLKCTLTSGALIFLALHKNFRFVKSIVAAVLCFYILLTCYHLYLRSVV